MVSTKKQKLKVLINAYACCPNMGSEPGMGWNWVVNLAKYCELYIITEGEFRDEIERVSPNLEQSSNMHFYYLPVEDRIRKMCWNQGDWRFYIYYKKWQKRAAELAGEICRQEKINILHQLNMIGFREPGYLWQVSQKTGIPFVWGPVDAKESFPIAYVKGESFKKQLFYRAKNQITKWQLKYSHRVRHAIKSASLVLSASSNSVACFRKYYSLNSFLMNETGACILDNNPPVIHKHDGIFNIMWVGKMDIRKQLGLAIKSVASAGLAHFCLHVVGHGDTDFYKREAEKYGIFDKCIFYGSISHHEVQQLMQTSDMLLFTSVSEGTPHVVVEAIRNQLPVLCFDTCGQGDSVTEKIGIKIPLTNPERSISDFSDKIRFLYHHRDVLAQMSANCQARSEELSWDRKAKQMSELYNKVVWN